MELNLYTNDQIDQERADWVKKIVQFTIDELNLTKEIELSIHFVDIAEIHSINKKYRDTDRPTDVISFAIEDGDETVFEQFEDIVEEDVGDLFICLEVVADHAKEYGHSLDRELGYTIVHGILHLNGYDHIEKDDEEKMISLQEKILTEFGLEK